ncbi:MAG: mercury resistance system transport protein MerF [Anaerolineae bacterium]
MNRTFLLRFGVVGTVIAALCCFTPVLVVLFAAVGLSWAVGYLDYVLFPALFIFLGITAYAVWRNRRTQPDITHPIVEETKR